MWPILVLFCITIQNGSAQFVHSYKTVIPYQIAGIFENANTLLYAFNESMGHITNGEIVVQPIILQPSRPDSYSTWRELCANKAMRPIAVIGPQHSISDGAIRDQCAIANIPHIQATWQPLDPDMYTEEEEEEGEEGEEGEGEEGEGENGEEETPEENEEVAEDEEHTPDEEADTDQNEEPPTFKKISINFFPDPDEINIAFVKLLKYYNWDTFAVLYEDDYGLMRIQQILANFTDKYRITVRRLDPESDNREVFKALYLYQDSRIVLDCHVDRINQYLDVAESMHMVNHYQHYIFTSLDVSTIGDSVQNRSCNTTWLSFTEYDRPDLAARVGKWLGPDFSNKDKIVRVQQFGVESLLMDDIANHIMHSLKGIKRKPLSPICGEGSVRWKHGALLQKKILETKTDGVTGNIQFDERGRRRNYILQINEKTVNEPLTVIGRWESNSSTIIETRTISDTGSKQMTSKVFRIMSSLRKPYFFEKEKCKENCEGHGNENDDVKYEGFAVDLVEEIFKFFRKERFNYSYVFVDEVTMDQGKYNKKEKKWDGMIGELLDKKVDLAVCDFTITEERKKVIDFSVPFMSLGISILYVKEQKKSPGMFSFLNPYTFDVWLYAITAYCGVSIVLFICARVSPADWENPEPCDKDPEELENIWTFKNCAWLTMGSIMTQGCDILPKAFGTRWVCGMWWFFAVIFCQTYIAQLSASMTSALENEPINSVEDLAKQTKILYGAFKAGSTLEFFRTSKDKMYRQMYENMAANPVVLVDSNDEGERRVQKGKGKYAFFMESTTIEYKLKRNCDLKKVGDELDSKDYGIAMPTNSPFRSQINRAILSLKESTILGDIKKKWWDEKYGAKNFKCDADEKPDDVEGDLEMENLMGLFVVLVGGLFLVLFVVAAEFFNEIRNIVIRERISHKEAFIQELKASLNFFQLQKPILRNPSRAPSIASSDESSENMEKRNLKAANAAAVLENFMAFEKEVQ